MALALVPRGAAERHAVIERAVVADVGGFADHHAQAVIDEKAPPDRRPRMDLDARQPACEVGKEAPEPLESATPAASN